METPQLRFDGAGRPSSELGSGQRTSTASERSPLLENISLLVGRRPEEALSAAPKVAVMITHWPEDGREKLEAKAEVVAEATLTFFDSPRYLVLVQLTPARQREQAGSDEEDHASLLDRPRCAVEQLLELQVLLDSVFSTARAEEGPWMWPLHDFKECVALVNIISLENDQSERDRSRFLRFCRSVSVLLPSGGSGVLRELRDRYGAGQAYSFAWSQAYVQMLWVLGIIAGIYFLSGGRHPASPESPRLQWELFKVVIILWGAALVISTWREGGLLAPRPSGPRDESLLRNPTFHERSRSEALCAYLWLAFGAFPMILLCVCIVATVLLGAIQFQAWIIWDWGDCINLGCRDAQLKHGFWGWLVEVSGDVLLAVIFEGLLALSQVLGEWVARLENHKMLQTHQIAVASHVIAFEAIGKVLPYVFIGLIFVPQWNRPIDDPQADCSDLLAYRIFGKSALQCVRRRVPLARRRVVFKLFMKGPFVVAPFIAILMKAVVPLVARGLDLAAEQAKSHKDWRWCAQVSGWVFRLTGVIFAHDCDSVGCYRYVFKGTPFGPLKVTDASTASSSCVGREASEKSPEGKEKLLKDGLQQGVRKLFEPIDELLELKLSFLWVLFFAPIMPVGVLPTLGARLLETRSDLTKMLMVRRRGFPEEASWLHTTQRYFAVCALLFAAVWSATLSLVTYNDQWWYIRWHGYR